MDIRHITAKIKASSNGGMYLTGTATAVNPAGTLTMVRRPNVAAPAPTPAPPTPSPHNSTIPPNSSLVDSNLATWTVVAGVVYKDSVAAGFTQNVTLLLYFTAVIYQQNSAGSWWSWNGTDWVITVDPRVTPSVKPTIANINRHPADLLQVGNLATDTYFIEDNRQVYSFTESTGGTSTFFQHVERQLSVGANGEVAFRAKWHWPVSVNGVLVENLNVAEVKGYPSIIYGARPGIQGPAEYPAWEKAVRLPDGVTVSAAPGGAPAGVVADWEMPGGSVSTTSPSGPTPGTDLPRQLPLASGTLLTTGRFSMSATGRCHMSFDIWLQDPNHPTQAFGFMDSPITHEIMIPLRNFGDYGRHGVRGQEWNHDVTIDTVTYHVYIASNQNRNDANGEYTTSTYAGLRYNFNALNPSFTNEETGTFRWGWKFIIFQHDGTAHPLLSDSSFSIDISKFLNHLRTRVDSRGVPFVQGNEHVVSVELGVEMAYGEGEFTVWDYRVRAPAP